MHYRTLGKTGIEVSAISFGAGPVSGWMNLSRPEQTSVVAMALDQGINWFDTAASYGDGRSESSLGDVLAGLAQPTPVHLASKVRLFPHQLDDIAGQVQRSVEDSLRRLRRDSLTLLQLHNSVTPRREELPTSLSLSEVLDPGGVLETMDRLRTAGKVRYLGLTGLGTPEVLRTLAATGAWSTVQIPFNLLNPSAGFPMPTTFAETDHGGLLSDFQALGMGVFAIRVFAAGALAGRPPSEHTRRTPFFPLDLYQRDQRRADVAAVWLDSPQQLPAVALRFVLDHPAVTSALVGFGTPEEIVRAGDWLETPAIPAGLRAWALAGANELEGDA